MKPFVKNFDELIDALKNALPHSYVFIADKHDDSIFDDLLVQPLVRLVNGNSITFIGVRVVKLKSKFKSNGLFGKFIDDLLKLNYPIIIHDIVNDQLFEYFQKRGFGMMTEQKYGKVVMSMYKIKFD